MNSQHTEKAYEFMRDKILEGIYPPGYRLQTVDLAKELSISRTPVREALRQLETDGLVELKPGLGASVRFIDAVAFREVCEFRLALESCAAEFAAQNQSREDAIDLETSFEAMEGLVAASERPHDAVQLHHDLVEEDIRFHFAILKAAHNRLIKDEILRLHVLNRVVNVNLQKIAEPSTYAPPSEAWWLERRKWVLESHRKILTAIRARDADGARKAMHEHIADIVDRSIRHFLKIERGREAHAKIHGGAQHTPYG